MTKKCNYERRTYEGLAPLTKEVRKIAMPILGVHGFATVDILMRWEDMIGPDLAQGVVPEKLVFGRDKRTGGTLLVRSAGGAFAMLFEHKKARVIERINTFFGYPAVNQIRIQQGALRLNRQEPAPERALTPDEEKWLAERTASIEDDDLRDRTYRLGKQLLMKQTA